MSFDIKKVKSMDRDDLLELIGLQTRRGPADWILPTAGIFGLGLLVGAGLGLILAPKSGRELREELRTKIQGEVEQLPTGAFAQAPAQGNASPRQY